MLSGKNVVMSKLRYTIRVESRQWLRGILYSGYQHRGVYTVPMDLLRGEGGRGSVKLLCPVLDVGRGMTLGNGRRAPGREVSIG